MLRVATWNVLHPAYAVPERYREIDPRHLEPRRRAAAVLDRVTQLMASYDVVALQEVDTTTARELVGEGTALLTAARPHAPDGVLLASRRHPLLRARTGASADGRRVWCSAEVEGVTGKYFNWDVKEKQAAKLALDEDLARRLWDFSAKLTKLA